MQGNVAADERQELDMKITELTETLEGKKETANMLTNALKAAEVSSVFFFLPLFFIVCTRTVKS